MASLDLSALQRSLFDAMGPRVLNMVADHLDYLETDGSPDQRQKFIEWAVRTMGAEADKKTGTNGLATVIVNIGVMGATTVGVNVAPAPPATVVVEEGELPEPSPLISAAADQVNLDLTGLNPQDVFDALTGLDDLC